MSRDNISGVTLIELLVVIIIVAILAAVAVPVYIYRIESTRGERAIANIELIADAMKIYRAKNGQFYNVTSVSWASAFPDPDTAVNSNITAINTNLNLDLSDSNFYYNINLDNINLDGTWYDIDVVRISGTYKGYKLMYGFNGNNEGWEPDGWHNPVWPWEPDSPKPWGA